MGGSPLNRFLKSAAFPILIVILLVFVAQRLVVSESTAAPGADLQRAPVATSRRGEISKVDDEGRRARS